MKRFMVLAAVVVISGVFGTSRAEALSPPAVRPVVGRCLFPSARALGAVISAEAQKAYFSRGYKQAMVGTRVLLKRPVVTNLTKGNVSGLTSVVPTSGNPAMVRITANAGGTPIELGCSTEAQITTTVILIDAAGVRSNGRSVTKVILQGTFQ